MNASDVPIGVTNALQNREQLCRDWLRGMDDLKLAALLRQAVPLPEAESLTREELGETLDSLDTNELGRCIRTMRDVENYNMNLVGEALSNRNMVDTVRWCIAQGLSLPQVCDCILEFCLQNVNGTDNATIVIIPMLGGRSLEEWQEWVTERVESGYGQVTPTKYEPFEPRSSDGRSLNAIVEEAKGYAA
jgi:hypothetical protein